MKILLAGIIGGIVMFVRSSIAHMALPLGEAGIGEIPNESAVLSAMQTSIADRTGLYIFPGLGVGKNATREEKNAAMKQMQQRIAAKSPLVHGNNIHIDADSLIRQNRELLRLPAQVRARSLLHLQNIIAWWQGNPILSIFVRRYACDFFLPSSLKMISGYSA